MVRGVSSSMMIPSQVLQNHSSQQSSSAQHQQQLPNQTQSPSSSSGPRRPFLSKARYKSYDGCIGGPVGPLPDLYANLDDGIGMAFRSGTGVSPVWNCCCLFCLELSCVACFRCYFISFWINWANDGCIRFLIYYCQGYK